MNFIADLSKSELEYICSKIPSKAISDYFQRHPKDFQKLRPGFRVKSLKQPDLSRILKENCDVPFISTFLNNTIQQYLDEIESYFQKRIEDGANAQKAYIETLSQSYFDENVPLYVKLAGKNDLTQGEIEFIEAAFQFQREVERQKRATHTSQEQFSRDKAEIEKKLRTREKEVSKLSARLERSENERLQQVDQNKDIKTRLEKTTARLSAVEKTLSRTEAIIRTQEGRISKLQQKGEDTAAQLVAEKLRAEGLEADLAAMREAAVQYQMRKRDDKLACAPDDMDEFFECFGYNLSSIGISDSDPYKNSLIQYLGKILFKGTPILTNQRVAASIAQCLSNTLTGEKEYEALTYSNEIKNQEIEDFLSNAGRVVCLNGFLGNFNELELLPIIGTHKDKIIFLSTTSERTIAYLANDMLLQCVYFNANRTAKLLKVCNTDEDGTILDEHPIKSPKYCPDERMQKIFDEIARQCCIPESLVELWKLDIQSEEDLCQMLAFTALPYCADVLYLRPYSVSPRLHKYAEKTGRCPDRDLLFRWFGRE